MPTNGTRHNISSFFYIIISHTLFVNSKQAKYSPKYSFPLGLTHPPVKMIFLVTSPFVFVLTVELLLSPPSVVTVGGEAVVVMVVIAMSDKATGILTERYDHGSAVVRCGVVVASRAVKAMEYRDIVLLVCRWVVWLFNNIVLLSCGRVEKTKI